MNELHLPKLWLTLAAPLATADDPSLMNHNEAQCVNYHYTSLTTLREPRSPASNETLHRDNGDGSYDLPPAFQYVSSGDINSNSNLQTIDYQRDILIQRTFLTHQTLDEWTEIVSEDSVPRFDASKRLQEDECGLDYDYSYVDNVFAGEKQNDSVTYSFLDLDRRHDEGMFFLSVVDSNEAES